jgi:hypothetical protein
MRGHRLSNCRSWPSGCSLRPQHRSLVSGCITTNRHVLTGMNTTSPRVMWLQVTPDGQPKVLDLVDCSGSGDVDMRVEVDADEDGNLPGLYGHRLAVNREWKNPTGRWRVGAKPLFELYPGGCRRRMEKYRKVRNLC